MIGYTSGFCLASDQDPSDCESVQFVTGFRLLFVRVGVAHYGPFFRDTRVGRLMLPSNCVYFSRTESTIARRSSRTFLYHVCGACYGRSFPAVQFVSKCKRRY